MSQRRTLKYFRACLILLIGAIFFVACEKDEMVSKAPNYNYFESFDSLPKVLAKGWVTVNNSRPVGIESWVGGYFTPTPFGFSGFPAHSYFASAQEYIAVNYNSGSDVSNISDWLISPVLNMKDGDSVYFWTRTVGPVNYPDRLQVYVNYNNDGTNVGNDYNSVGDFDLLVLDVNPTLSPYGFPVNWTQFSFAISNGSSTPKKGRVGFRYFVEKGGPSGNYSNIVGLDDFNFVSKK